MTRGKLVLMICFFAAVAVGMASEANKKSRLSDLEIAKREYVDKSPAFTEEARASAVKLITELRGQVASMTDEQFLFALARIPALADNAHDTFYPDDGAWVPTLRLPVRMIWFPDALIIARAAPEQASLLGASVIALEGLILSQLMKRLRPLQGGVDPYRRWQLNWIFHSPEALHALRIADAPDRLRMRLKLKDGTVTDAVVIAQPKENVPAGQHPSRYWPPDLWPGEKEKGWRAAVDPVHAPLYLQDGNAWFRMTSLSDLHTLYIQFRTNMDEEDANIAPSVSSVTERLRSDPPQNIIVDLRFDTGGDNTQNRYLMKMIALKVPGRIYLLVGNYTFSAGIASAAALAHDGGRINSKEGKKTNLPSLLHYAGDFLKWGRRTLDETRELRIEHLV